MMAARRARNSTPVITRLALEHQGTVFGISRCGRPQSSLRRSYSQLKEDPIHIIVLDVQRVKRRAERATGLANGKCYEIRCGDFEEMTKELADGSAEGEDDFAKGRAAVSKMKTTPVDAGASRLRTMRERAREARHAVYLLAKERRKNDPRTLELKERLKQARREANAQAKERRKS